MNPQQQQSEHQRGIASHYVTVNGVRLHYLSKGQGPMLVLLHGFPEYSGLWLDYIDALSDSYRVVAPDLRGYNLSAKPAELEAYELPHLLQDIVELVAALGGGEAFVAGHDWGAILAWYLADGYPQVFSKLVIMNGPHPQIYHQLVQHDLEQKVEAAYIGLFLLPKAERVLAALDFKALQLMTFKMSDYPFSAEEKAGYLEAWGRGLTGPLNYYRAYMCKQEEYIAKLRGIKMPVLVLWGLKDKAISQKNLIGLEAHAPDLRIVRYDDATHWVTYEKCREICAEMRAFL